MKAALVMGLMLVVGGVSLLGYFASPVRILMSAYVPHHIDVKIPIAGGLSLGCHWAVTGLSLGCGIAVLFMCSSRKP